MSRHDVHYTVPNSGLLLCNQGNMILMTRSSSLVDDVTCEACKRYLRVIKNSLSLKNSTEKIVAAIKTREDFPGPPEGLLPRAQWEKQRMSALMDAMVDYRNQLKDVPAVWVNEYVDLWKLHNVTVPEHFAMMKKYVSGDHVHPHKSKE